MEKEIIIKEVFKNWCEYGKAINKAFGFENFYIESETLQKVIQTKSEDRIKSFNEYIKLRISEL